MKHRPDECPTCGFVWGHYQGNKHGDGYIRLAADVWECARCSKLVAGVHPLHKQVARR